MEPPMKRARMGLAPYDADDEEDEISMDPVEFEAKQDPGYQLDKSRARAEYKLKSAFEQLFEKYGKDFSDVGDEINLYTDEIEVDRGHIASLPNAGQDANDDADDSLDEEERILHGGRAERSVVLYKNGGPPAQRTPWVSGGPPRLTNLYPPGFGFMDRPLSFGSFGSFGAFGLRNPAADATWRVPDLPESAFNRGFRHSLGGGSYAKPVVVKRTVVRKSLPMTLDDSDDEDLILLGASGDKSAKKDGGKGAESRGLAVQGNAEGSAKPADGGRTAAESAPDVGGVQMETDAALKPRKVSSLASRKTSQRQESSHTKPDLKPAQKPKNAVAAQNATARKIQGVSAKGRPSRSKVIQDEEGPLSTDGEVGKQVVVVKSRRPRGRPRPSKTESIRPLLDARRRRSPAERSQEEPCSDATHSRAIADAMSRLKAERLVIEITEVKPPPTPREEVADSADSGGLSSPAAVPPGDDAMEPSGEVIEVREEPTGQDVVEQPSVPIDPVVQEQQCAPEVQEAFSRNAADPSYAFSDEEDGLIRRKPRKQQASDVAADEPKAAATEAGLPRKERAKRESTAAAPSKKVPTDVPLAASESRGRKRKARPSEPEIQPATPNDNEPQPEAAPAGDDSVVEKSTTELPKTRQERRRRKERPAEKAPLPTPSPQPSTSPTSQQQNQEATSDGAVPPDEDDLPLIPRKHPQPPPPALPPTTPQQANEPRNKPSPQKKTGPSAKSKRSSIISLVSDSDEDELSLGPGDFTPGGGRSQSRRHRHRHGRPHLSSSPEEQHHSRHHRSAPTSVRRSGGSASASASMRKAVLKRGLLFSSHNSPTTTTTTTTTSTIPKTPTSSKQGRASFSLAYRGKQQNAKGSSGGAKEAAAGSVGRHFRPGRAPSPTGSLVWTPGGTMRRCGEDGFRCDRDFCFICL